jgi:RNA polymerase sigma factor (sigma-70 family)
MEELDEENEKEQEQAEASEDEEVEVDKQFSDKAMKDFALIDKAFNQGDQKAYAELMDRYRKPLYHTMLKMVKNTDDAEDLTIEAFAKAFRGLGKFKKEYTFSTWLFRIATNNCIDFIRKKRLETLSISSSFKDDSGDDVEIDIRDYSLDPQETAIKSQKEYLMQMIVGKLPVKYQRLVELRYFKELSYEEIADKIDIPLGTVKAQLHRAKELLFDMIKDKREII